MKRSKTQIYFIPYLFYFYLYYFICSLVILRFTLLFITRLFGLLPFPTFHTIFSHYSQPAPKAALGHTDAGSRTDIREATFRVSPSPPLLRAVLFFILLIYSFISLIFTVGLFGIYLSTFILIFSSFTVTLFHIVFPTVLAVCILGTPSSYTLIVSTPLSPYWLSSHHTVCYPAALSKIYVIGFLSHSDS